MPVATSPPATTRQRSARLAGRANDHVAPASSLATPAKETQVSTEVREIKTKTGGLSASGAPPRAASAAPTRGRVVDFVGRIKDRW
jgi:hypothetical protein